MTKVIALIMILGACAFSCSDGGKKASDARSDDAGKKEAAAESKPKITKYSVSIVRTYPHETDAFTQGLEIRNGKLYESVGQTGKSAVRLVDIATGKAKKTEKIPAPHFGEGITIFKNKLYFLTWQSKVGFIFDPETFKQIGTWNYPGEGWGLTHDDKYLIMSDGTNMLRFIDPETMETVRTISVNLDGGKPIGELNELEYIEGEVWANVWMTNFIVRIDPSNGKIKGIIDASPLESRVAGYADRDVLNGIAYDAETKKIYLTGKNWPYLFEVAIKEIKE